MLFNTLATRGGLEITMNNTIMTAFALRYTRPANAVQERSMLVLQKWRYSGCETQIYASHKSYTSEVRDRSQKAPMSLLCGA